MRLDPTSSLYPSLPIRPNGLLPTQVQSPSWQAPDRFDASVLAARAESVIAARPRQSLERDLWSLTRDPAIASRDATEPVGFKRTVDWAAARMRAMGVEPLGDWSGGGRTFLQAFGFDAYWAQRPVRSWNVIGRIPGAARPDGQPNPALVVIGHIDNLSFAQRDRTMQATGVDLTTYEGANDNATAVATVLDLVPAIQALGPLPIDVIVFIPSGEEDGLKGTEAAIRAFPVPLDRVKGAINFEMTGFPTHLLYGGESHQEAGSNPLFQRLMKVARQSGASWVDGVENDGREKWWTRSDHFPFHEEGIPSIAIFGQPPPGVYHTRFDTLERVDVGRVEDGRNLALRLIADFAADPAPQEARRPTSGFQNAIPGRVWF